MQAQSVSCWSRLPPELALEIAAYNADDAPSLRAMCLVSKAIRSLGIEHLFSFIQFSCAQDFSWWDTMVHRTPRLRNIVKKVKFSNEVSNFEDEGWMMRHPEVYAPKGLHEAVVPPQILTMPNVHIVEWEGDLQFSFAVSMACAYMALFPNVTELDLRYLTFSTVVDIVELLSSCRRLRVLSTCCTDVLINTSVDPKSPPLDLTALEELRIESYTCIFPLVQSSPPATLFSLKWVDFEIEEIQAAEMVLQLAAPSLVNLDMALNPLDSDEDAISLLVEQFRRMPTLPSLERLSISLAEAEPVLDALKAVPTLTTLILRIPLPFADDELDHPYFDAILQSAFPWGGQPESMKSVLTWKFPFIRRIGFHFCAPNNSTIHFRRDLRRRMERQLMERLEETGAHVAEYLELNWLDGNYDPVVYNKINGKPPWKLEPDIQEPDTEESDCEWDEEEMIQCFDCEESYRRGDFSWCIGQLSPPNAAGLSGTRSHEPKAVLCPGKCSNIGIQCCNPQCWSTETGLGKSLDTLTPRAVCNDCGNRFDARACWGKHLRVCPECLPGSGGGTLPAGLRDCSGCNVYSCDECGPGKDSDGITFCVGCRGSLEEQEEESACQKCGLWLCSTCEFRPPETPDDEDWNN
ncbi:hypothetical protein DFH06DRAFT_1468977 [Mycena polygramma]|nr:hypothetical protein DFH06DRAFT_1468977 [Mycena polygramma]